jgi:hypothetical protein
MAILFAAASAIVAIFAPGIIIHHIQKLESSRRTNQSLILTKSVPKKDDDAYQPVLLLLVLVGEIFIVAHCKKNVECKWFLWKTGVRRYINASP